MMNEEKIPSTINEEELIKRVEKAARDGAKAGAKGGLGRGVKGTVVSVLAKILVPAIVCLLVVMLVVPNINPLDNLRGLFDREEAVSGHDMTIENHGIFGYTAADFSDVILGKAAQQKKVEVYSREVTEATTVTEAGLIKFKIFSKNQIITYNAIATYTVDLSKLDKKSFKLNNDTRTLTMYIPHAQLEDINVPSDKIEFGEVEKGALAFGKIKLSPEQTSSLQTEAVSRMKEKLKEDKVKSEADKYAKLTMLDIYQPIIKTVSPQFTLEVEFVEE